MIKIQTHGQGHRAPCGALLKRLFTSLTPEINRYTGDVSRLDIEVSGESRPSDKLGRGGGRSSRPLDKGESSLQKKIFRPFGPHFRLKIKGGGAAGPLPWIRHWRCYGMEQFGI